MIERGGQVVLRVLENVQQATIKPIIFQFWDLKPLTFRRFFCYDVVYGQLSSHLSYEV